MEFKSFEDRIEVEKEYLTKVLGKSLTDSEERNDCQSYSNKGYVQLAKKYWPEEFDGTDKEVHHINFDHEDNRACNLVVLTPKEHVDIHKMFSPYWEEKNKRISESRKGMKFTEEHIQHLSESHKGREVWNTGTHESGMKGKHHSEESRNKISQSNTGKKRSQEAIENMKEAWKSRKREMSKEAREKIAQAVREAWKRRKDNK